MAKSRRELVAYTDFRGGISEIDPDNMNNNELNQADNIELSNRGGGFSYRPGTINMNDVSYGEDVEQLIELPLVDGHVKILAVRDKKLYDVTDDRNKLLSPLYSNKIAYFFMNNRLYFADGDKYRVYGYYKYTTQSGTKDIKKDDIVRNFPISTHATNPGIIKGFYKAKSSHGSIDLSKADYGDSSKWEDITDGSIPDDVREVEADSDSTNDLSPIPKCKHFIYHTRSHRIFASGNENDAAALYYSEIDKPDFFKATSKLYPTRGDGPVRAIVQIFDILLCGYSHSWWGWQGLTVEDATWGNYPIPYGIVSSDSLVITPGGFAFLSYDGIYEVSSSMFSRDIALIAGDKLIKKISDDKVNSRLRSITDLMNVKGIFHDNRYYLSYSDAADDEKTRDNILLCYWNDKSFVRYTGIKANCLLRTYKNELLIGTKNWILKLDPNIQNDVDEDGSDKAIRLYVETRAFNFDNPIGQKIFHRFFIWSNQNVDRGNELKVTLRIDFANTSFDVDLNSASLIWGTKWGGVWGFADIAPQEANLRELAIKGIRCKVIFESENINTLNSVVVYGIAFEIEHLAARANQIDLGHKLLS